ncbi:MAG TPA: hypothetical protein VKQ72_00295 [Aggregatilineales bacterium]|nr:hypothetical protein [Aggregatilineales bacterium]
MDEQDEQIPTEVLAETESYSVWVSQEPDGEVTYHVEVGAVTVHFFEEEWQEFLKLIQGVQASKKS